MRSIAFDPTKSIGIAQTDATNVRPRGWSPAWFSPSTSVWRGPLRVISTAVTSFYPLHSRIPAAGSRRALSRYFTVEPHRCLSRVLVSEIPVGLGRLSDISRALRIKILGIFIHPYLDLFIIYFLPFVRISPRYSRLYSVVRPTRPIPARICRFRSFVVSARIFTWYREH